MELFKQRIIVKAYPNLKLDISKNIIYWDNFQINYFLELCNLSLSLQQPLFIFKIEKDKKIAIFNPLLKNKI